MKDRVIPPLESYEEKLAFLQGGLRYLWKITESIQKEPKEIITKIDCYITYLKKRMKELEENKTTTPQESFNQGKLIRLQKRIDSLTAKVSHIDNTLHHLKQEYTDMVSKERELS